MSAFAFPCGIGLHAHVAHWPEWITAIATTVLAVAAIAALANLIDARRTRHAHIVTDLSRRWDEPAATDARRRSGDYDAAALVALIERVYRPPLDATEAEREADVEELYRLGRWLNVLETVGVLYTEKTLSERLIFKLWAGQFAAAWEKWESAISLMRDLERRPGIYGNFQEVAERMRHLLAKELQAERVRSVGPGGRGRPGGAEHSADTNDSSSSYGQSNRQSTRCVLVGVAAVALVSAIGRRFWTNRRQ
jgi:hypothetical protein